MKKTYTLLLALCMMCMAMPLQAAMYIVGNAPFGDWKTNAGVEMSQSGSTYTATVDISGDVYFVFATRLCTTDSDWDTFNSYRMGPRSNGTVVTEGNTYTAYTGQGGNSFKITGNGTFTFTFNSSGNTFTVTAENGSSIDPVTGELYILGEAEGNTWDPSVGVPMETTDGNVFTCTGVTFRGEWSEEDANVSYFSFTTRLSNSSTDWDGIMPYRLTPVCDGGSFWVTSAMLGTAIGLNPLGTNTDMSFRIPAGTYTITVNVEAKTCVITRESGGDSVVAGKGWPATYGGVMLQGFYWDSYGPTKWSNLTDRAQELGQYFDIIWIPNSGTVDAYGTSESMGYMPVYWLKHNSVFGSETQLRDMISTYRNHHTTIMGDVVINHKNGVSSWTDFAEESVVGSQTGTTYSLSWTSADICSNDECTGSGYAATGAADEGDNFGGARDLDHTSLNVQKNVKTYEHYLIDELGYGGFRYDMVKGYAGYYVGLYNAASQPVFSVGEYWDSSADNLRAWLENTKQDGRIMSACFDFALKYVINDAFGNNAWGALSDKGLSADGNYQRYSVSFVDNHDTGSNDYTGTLSNNIMPANAFILAMPGTPCIFLKHYQVYAPEIINCIKARRAAGIHNQSAILTQEESNGGYILETQGTRGRLYLQLGGATANGTPSGYTLVQKGDNYSLFITQGIDWAHVAKDGTLIGHPVVSQAGGTFAGSVTLTVAPSDSETTLVYTTDGSVPTTTSASLTAPQAFTFTESTTLRVAVRHGDGVENVETFVYTIADEAPTGLNVYVQSTSSQAHIYAWDSEGTLTDSWPGTPIADLPLATVNGIQWHCLPVGANAASVIFNDGNGGFQHQTATIPVARDLFIVYPDAQLAAMSYSYAANDTYADLTERYAGGGNYETVYVMGDINETGWAANNGLQMATTNGDTYTADITIFQQGTSGYGYFSFTTCLGTTASAWNEIAEHRFGASTADCIIDASLLGTDITCSQRGTDSFQIPAGEYHLTLNLLSRTLRIESAAASLRGDVNGDAQVTIADVTALVNIVLGKTTVYELETADVNGDSLITIADVTALVNVILGK